LNFPESGLVLDFRDMRLPWDAQHNRHNTLKESDLIPSPEDKL